MGRKRKTDNGSSADPQVSASDVSAGHNGKSHDKFAFFKVCNEWIAAKEEWLADKEREV